MTNEKNRIFEMILHFNHKYNIFENKEIFDFFILTLADIDFKNYKNYEEYEENIYEILNKLNINNYNDNYISTFKYTLKRIKIKKYNSLTNNIIEEFEKDNNIDYNFDSKYNILKIIKKEVEKHELL